MKHRTARRLTAALALALPFSAIALSGTAPAREVVQPLPSQDTVRLNAALAKLGRDPRDVEALLDAGDAASAMGDADAALGFFRRADQISANNPRVKAGMASALVLKGDPVAAIPMFDAAVAAGASADTLAAERGLAYDLVGDSARAQQYYAAALKKGDNEVLRRRLAVSQAIAGDGAASEATLMPLLREQDKPAWRTRAFTLAILGDIKEAVKISNTILPAELAERVAPYLRYMPRLTPAQQAAAANLGQFPRASEIGRDDPKIAAYAPKPLAQPKAGTADAGLIPQGSGLGKKAASADRPKQAAPARSTKVARAEQERVAPPEPKPAIERSGGGQELPPLNAAASAKAAETKPAAAPSATASPPPQSQPVRQAVAPGSSATPAPGFDLARLSSARPAQATSSSPRAADIPSPASIIDSSSGEPTAASSGPAQAAVAPEPEPERVSLLDAFSDLGKPSTQGGPISGAVDLRRIEPAKPEPKPDPAELAAAKAREAAKAKPKPAPPSHPSRIWVQLGVGRNKDAIAFDWRKWTRGNAALFKGREAHISQMGRTNRVLAGPFESQKAAASFLADAGKAGFDGAFVWTSPAGQVVDILGDK
ncbi:hypothetical protein B2G71_10040 [Novosphingobium sp. PC22D]|uniref:SPOR domain-containing protein n=1 Tax=Novosphingobium sp. PC22D TaxID=1962403 RepID=UPI000BFAF5A8|nr:SPOR domain-containing protein [Novosphingobium sp. PC22D]PEQ12643.1 hypothetical protein B2G71_10040 [Novosphingobium sp. PC22D]